MKQKFMFVLAFLVVCTTGNAQKLLNPSFSFSHKKTAYITLTDGTELQGNIKDIDRTKGLIDYVKLKDGNGKKHKLKAEDIKFMYLPPSGIDKLAKAMDFATDAQKWHDAKMDDDLLNLGYIYFELSDVKIKKKNKKLLMQLLNPTFSKVVKVYHDPFAKETMGFGIGGITLAGGDAKSYYIAKDDKPAYKLKKKDYRTEFTPMWKSCEKVASEYPDQKWTDLTKHVITFSECSE